MMKNGEQNMFKYIYIPKLIWNVLNWLQTNANVIICIQTSTI